MLECFLCKYYWITLWLLLNSVSCCWKCVYFMNYSDNKYYTSKEFFSCWHFYKEHRSCQNVRYCFNRNITLILILTWNTAIPHYARFWSGWVNSTLYNLLKLVTFLTSFMYFTSCVFINAVHTICKCCVTNTFDFLYMWNHWFLVRNFV